MEKKKKKGKHRYFSQLSADNAEDFTPLHKQRLVRALLYSREISSSSCYFFLLIFFFLHGEPIMNFFFFFFFFFPRIKVDLQQRLTSPCTIYRRILSPFFFLPGRRDVSISFSFAISLAALLITHDALSLLLYTFLTLLLPCVSPLLSLFTERHQSRGIAPTCARTFQSIFYLYCIFTHSHPITISESTRRRLRLIYLFLHSFHCH